MFADFFNCFIFSFVEDYFILFKQIPAFCVDGHDEWSEFFDAAVP